MSQRLHRKSKAADTLEGIVEELRKDAILDDKACGSIKAAADNIPAEIVKQMTSNLKSKKKKKRPQKYSDSMREFAITLQFYSSSACDYVRSVCGNALPIRSTITGWFSNIYCDS